MLLADNETKFDLLNNEAIAKTIVGLIGEDTERAVTVGVHGDWGAGKSSVLEMIEGALDGSDDVLCIKFNAWRFQGLEDAKIALIEGIVTQLIEKRSLTTKAADAVMDVVKRLDWLKLARMGGGLAFTAMSGLPSPDHVGAVVGMVALRVRGRHVASYAIRGVHVANPTAQWARKIAEHEAEFARRQEAVPEVFGDGR